MALLSIEWSLWSLGGLAGAHWTRLILNWVVNLQYIDHCASYACSCLFLSINAKCGNLKINTYTYYLFVSKYMPPNVIEYYLSWLEIDCGTRLDLFLS